MKKHLIFAMTAIFCTAMLISCSSSKAKITITEEDAEYSADVFNQTHWGESGNDFFQIVPGTYDVVSKKGSLTTTILLKIVEGKKYPSLIAEEFILNVINADDEVIEMNGNAVDFLAVDKDAKYRALCDASIGDVVTVTFTYTPANSKELEEIAASIVSCQIELSIDEPEEVEEEVEEDVDDAMKAVRDAQKEALEEVQKAQQEALKEVGDAYGKAAKEANDAYQQALKEANDAVEGIW